MQSEKENVRKALYLALAILIAVLIWFYVDEFGKDGSPNLHRKEFEDVTIEYINESALMDHGLMLVEEGSDQTVDLQLEAPRRLLAEIDPDKIHVTVDLSNVLAAGSQTIQPRLSYNGYRINGRRITITQSMLKEMNPFMATVNIKELNSKSIDVRCELRGNVAEGYSAGQLHMSDTSIEIWGQEKDLAPISYAKVILDIGSGAVNSVSESLPIMFYGENDLPLDGMGVRSTIRNIKVTMPVSVTKELRLAVDFLEAPGARKRNVKSEISPETITVSGDASRLNGVDTIVLTEFDLLELKNQNGVGHYTYPITVPEGCINLSGVTQATMTISFSDMAASEVTTDRFVYEHLPVEKEIQRMTEEMTVSVYGTAADVAAVTPEDVTILLDFTDYTAASGSYTIPAQVMVKSAGDIGVSGKYEVRVIIREKSHEDLPQDTPENDMESTETGE